MTTTPANTEPLTADQLLDALLDHRLVILDRPRHPNYSLVHMFAVCARHQGSIVRFTELLVGTSRSAIQRRLARLRDLGAITTTCHSRSGIEVKCHPVCRWTGSAPAAETTAKPATDTPDEIAKKYLPDILRTPTTATGAARDYSAELAMLDSRPELRGKIKVSWLDYIERNLGADIKRADTNLLALCDSFVHEYLGKKDLGKKALANPKTDWELALNTHVKLHVAPDKMKRRHPGRRPPTQQRTIKFNQRTAAPTNQPTRQSSAGAPSASPNPNDSNPLAAAAMAHFRNLKPSKAPTTP